MFSGARALLVMASRHAADIWAALESRGFEVDHVVNCREAREFFQRGVDVDLVVTDLSLPDGNWWTISREMAQRGHHAGLLVCAPAAAGHGAVPPNSARGLAEVIAPPFDPATIECALEKLGVAGCAILAAAAGF